MGTPRILIGYLPENNYGEDASAWISCDQDADGIRADILEKVAKCPDDAAAEWVIQDKENFGDFDLSDIDEAAEIGQMIANSSHDVDLLHTVHNDIGVDIGDLESWIDENCQGEFDSMAEFAENMANECGDLTNVPKWLQYHIDWEAAGRDLESDFVMIDGRVFRNC